jgi:hypothetical protein
VEDILCPSVKVMGIDFEANIESFPKIKNRKVFVNGVERDKGK